MLLARVAGQVWGAKQAESLSGRRLLVVQPLTASARPGSARQGGSIVNGAALEAQPRSLVAVDQLGAGPGELVLVAHGSRCRDLTMGESLAAKDVILAIVDDAQIFLSREQRSGQLILGRVAGTVWCTRKHHKLTHLKLLLIAPHFHYNLTHDARHLVAIDTLGAGVGEDVVVCLGAPARWSQGDLNLPVDAAVLGIVDRCQMEERAFSAEARRPLSFMGRRGPNHLEWI